MHPAYSVILFTTASGAGYGLLALLGLVGAVHGPVSSWWFGVLSLLVALGLISAGLLSSTFHLGHPERSWRAFSQWRSSWLSREGVAAVATYAPALIFGYFWITPGSDAGLIRFFGLATAGMCAITVFFTSMIYASLPTIRQWRHPLVPAVYLTFALATGAVLLLTIASFFGLGQKVQVMFAAGGLAAALVLKAFYWLSIDRAKEKFTIADATGLGHLGALRQWEVPHTGTNFLLKEMGYKVARKHARKLRVIVIACLMAAILACLTALAGPSALGLIAAVAASVLAAIAVVLERWLFFAEARHVVNLYYGARSA